MSLFIINYTCQCHFCFYVNKNFFEIKKKIFNLVLINFGLRNLQNTGKKQNKLISCENVYNEKYFFQKLQKINITLIITSISNSKTITHNIREKTQTHNDTYYA